MQCFAFNAAVDPTLIRVRDPGFGQPVEFGKVTTVRGLLTAEEAECRLGELFARFILDVRSEHARGALEEAYHWALQGSTQLHGNLALSLRIFRELLPQAFLMTLFGPGDSADPPHYLFNGLDELRGINGTLVFAGTAWVSEPEPETLELPHQATMRCGPALPDHAGRCGRAPDPAERSETD